MFSTNRYFRLVTQDGTDWRGRQQQAERGALSFIFPFICGIFLLVPAVWYAHLLPLRVSHTDFLLDLCILGCHGSKSSCERGITIMPGTIILWCMRRCPAAWNHNIIFWHSWHLLFFVFLFLFLFLFCINDMVLQLAVHCCRDHGDFVLWMHEYQQCNSIQEAVWVFAERPDCIESHTFICLWKVLQFLKSIWDLWSADLKDVCPSVYLWGRWKLGVICLECSLWLGYTLHVSVSLHIHTKV